MNLSKLRDSLRRLFEEERHRIVFWYDAGREFEEELASLALPGVTVVRLDEVAALELKIRLELEDTTSPYLIYAPYAEPEPEKNWLLDIRLYSRVFQADSASMLLEELGLSNQAMRAHIAIRQTFFRSQDRVNRLKKWVRSTDNESDLDLKMLAVLTRAEQPEAFNIVMRLLSEFCDQGECDLSQPPKTWSEIEKYDLAGFFWDMTARTFGYLEAQSNLSDLLIRLLVTDFAESLKSDVPQSLRHFMLPNKTLALNASVLLSQWRGNISHHSTYNALSRHIAKEMKIEDHLSRLDESSLIDVMTFEAVEQRIIRCLRDHVAEIYSINLESLKAMTARRRDGHWASPLLGAASGDSKNIYQTVYDAIECAAELLELRRKYADGLSYASAEAMYSAYIEELYRFDQLYRLFNEAADQVKLKGWDILKHLREVIESCYSGWFIDQVAATWSGFVSPPAGEGLLHRWKVQNIRNQQDFYRSNVEPIVEASPQSKVYVIISDAFRFEAAEELTRELNGKNRLKAMLNSQLGVLPSYTALGMAALLPHKTLDYKFNAGPDVTINGQSTASLEQRARILAEAQGTAIKAEQLMAMSRDQGREFVKPWRVIYVYHNQIDATGEPTATESKTFSAVRMTINELSALVRFIINNLNGSQVLVTADHGFLYQETAPGKQDKSGLEDKPAGTLKAKKRYLLGSNLGNGANTWHGNTRITAGTESEMEFWIPRGANRFHFIGGARFIHGGAMLQEIVVPVISVKGLRGQEAERSTVRKVDVSLLGSIRKVVNNVQRFDFIQTDAVSERVQPRTLLVSLRFGEELISNEEALTFDSQSASMDERKKSARLVVKSGQYDKKAEYALVLRDAETKIEYDRIPITIDLAFMNDF